MAEKPLPKSAKRYELCVYAVGASWSDTICVSQETFEGTPRMMRHRGLELATQGPVKAFEYYGDKFETIPCESWRHTPVKPVDSIDALAIARIAFPEWRGKKATIVRQDAVELLGTFWDGGSKNTFRAVNIATGETSDAARGMDTPVVFGGKAANQSVRLPPGFAIVEHIVFCGKELGCRVYLAPEPTLEAGAETQAIE